MVAAEDDDAAHYRPQATDTEPDDAVDDAHDVYLVCSVVPKRSGSLLGDL